MKETDKCEEILKDLSQIALEEGLDIEDENILYSPLSSSFPLAYIRTFNIWPKKMKRKHPSVSIEYNANVELSEESLAEWKTDGTSLYMKDVITRFDPVVLSPMIRVSLERWYDLYYDDSLEYFIGSDGLVFYSPHHEDSDPDVPYRNFTNKSYERMFRHVLQEFRRLSSKK